MDIGRRSEKLSVDQDGDDLVLVMEASHAGDDNVVETTVSTNNYTSRSSRADTCCQCAD